MVSYEAFSSHTCSVQITPLLHQNALLALVGAVPAHLHLLPLRHLPPAPVAPLLALLWLLLSRELRLLLLVYLRDLLLQQDYIRNLLLRLDYVRDLLLLLQLNYVRNLLLRHVRNRPGLDIQVPVISPGNIVLLDPRGGSVCDSMSQERETRALGVGLPLLSGGGPKSGGLRGGWKFSGGNWRSWGPGRREHISKINKKCDCVESNYFFGHQPGSGSTPAT